MPAAVAGVQGQGAAAAPVQYGTVLPVGPQHQMSTAAVAPTTTAGNPVLVTNIFSADEDAAMENEDAWVEEETIQELDEEVRDPIRVYSRMGKVNKAIMRREKRLDKARHEVELQKMVVDEAQAVLATRAQAVDTIDADLRRLREVQQDLSTRHAKLVAEAAQQQRYVAQPSVEDAAQKAQQLLWSTASSLRELGDDPRLSQAIALLGSLFQDASATAAAPLGELGCSPPAQQLHTAPPPQSAVQSPANPGVPTAIPACAPTATPITPIICPECWSVACRCRPLGAAGAPGPAAGMEVDQDRGKKRSCNEAALPERSAGAQQNPAALLVDSSGAPASPGTTEADEKEEQQPKTTADESSGAAAVRGTEALAAEHQQAEAMVVEPAGEPANPAPTLESPVGEETSSCDASGVPESYAKAEKLADHAAKEESRSSFSTLVKAACSQRSYPY